MEISSFFKKSPKDKPVKKYFIIKLKDKSIETAVLTIEDDTPKVTSIGDQLEYADTESLIDAVDKSLSDASETDAQTVSDAIFSIPEFWIEHGQVKAEAAQKLKKLIKELALNPTGYVATTDAILNYLRHTEGNPPNVVLVDVGEQMITILVARTGRTDGLIHIERSSDLAGDIDTGLKKLNLSPLPSRILLFNDIDDETSLKLNSHTWSSELNFMHLPKVDTLPRDYCITAIGVTGGIEAAAKLGISLKLAKEAPIEDSPDQSIPNAQESLEESEINNNVLEDQVEDEDEFGFVTDKDIRNIDSVPAELERKIIDTLSGQSVDNYQPSAETDLTPNTPKDLPIEPVKKPKPKFTLPKFSFPDIPKGKLAVPAAIILLLLVILPVSAYFVHQARAKAVITVLVKGQDLNKDLQFALNDAKGTSMVVVPAQTETLELEKSDETSTTGETIIGDKATGEVTIFNKTDTSRSLKSGTVLASSSNLKYVLDETVTVASRSAEEKDGGVNIVYGQVNAKVTASRIGADHNLPSNTVFTVADFPKTSLDAKSTKEFTGGSSKTVKAVSKKDRDDLIAKVEAAIKEEAKTQLEAKSTNQAYFPVGDLKTTKQTFSKGVDEEADTLSLTIKSSVSLVKFDKDQLKNLIKTQILPDIPSGMTADLTKINFEVKSIEESGGVTILTVKASAKLTPEIIPDHYKKVLMGAKVTDIKNEFRNLPGYQNIEVVIKDGVPFFTSTLPKNADNLTIQINTLL